MEFVECWLFHPQNSVLCHLMIFPSRPLKVLKMNKLMKNDDIKDSLDSKNNHKSLSELDQQNIKENTDEQ